KDVEKNGGKYKLGKEFNQKFMRKGIAGDWKNHFTRQMAVETETVFGDLLRLFEYESDAHWWKEVT
ncbi:sulfotransferase domain-containing protein, partial [bacterium]|nr:sulfotransferase domain-containing protein [bacterium]